MIKTCEFNDGTVYEGEWDEDSDSPHGKGVMIFPEGEMYEGDFIKGRSMHGEGLYTYVDGSTYSGSFVNSLPHGKGTKTYADGDVYIGDFKEGMIEGYGRMTFVDGEFFEGIMSGFVNPFKCN